MTMLRPAVVDDTASLLALEADVFGSEAWGIDAVTAELAGGNRSVAVAEVEGSVVGYAAVSTAGDVADLTRIAVALDVRRLGVGAVLVMWAIEAARAAGAERMVLEVAESNDAALGLYLSTGFTEISRRPGYYPGGVDALVLERSFRP
jgi:ribosomal-protein-alanine acetyltransferase